MAKDLLTGKAFIERLDMTFTVIEKINRAALSSLIAHDEKDSLINELRTEVNMLLAERGAARSYEVEKLEAAAAAAAPKKQPAPSPDEKQPEAAETAPAEEEPKTDKKK